MSDALVLALHACPRAGKDTLADALVDRFGFSKLGFGDAVYQEVAAAFGVFVSELRSHKWKTEPQPLLALQCCDSPKFRAMMECLGFDPKEPQTSRTILRFWATEYRRAQDPFYWVREAASTLDYWPKSNIVVNDLRFLDSEHPYLADLARRTKRRMAVIEIVSEWQTPRQHVSDRRLPDDMIDITIQNVKDNPETMIENAIKFLNLNRTATK